MLNAFILVSNLFFIYKNISTLGQDASWECLIEEIVMLLLFSFSQPINVLSSCDT